MIDDVGDQPEDSTGELARTLGLPPAELVDLIGASWRMADGEPPHDYDLDPSGGGGMDATPWHVAGDPVQLMARVFGHGIFLARPVGRWAHGTHGLVHDPVDQEYVSRFEIERAAEVAQRLVTRRRNSFRWCRYCRRPVPPEERFDSICQGCASRWLGVVY